VTEIPLVGGDANVVVRVGDTVRVANGETVLANLRWLEEHRTELDTVLA
jgi:hypothetical protein